MGKKNWIEFNNLENNQQVNSCQQVLKKKSKLIVSKKKKGKKGKTITLIQGLNIEDESKVKQLLKKMKVFCCTGGTLIKKDIQLQGDMVKKSKEVLRQEGFQI